jgi:hypothetical protein
MIGRAEYRLAIEQVTQVIQSTSTWPDAYGDERTPFVEAPYREPIDDGTGLPASAAHRKFQILVTGTGSFRGRTSTLSGAQRDRTMDFSVTVAYQLGHGDQYDERELRILAAQDSEAIRQRVTHPLNWAKSSTLGTGMLEVSDAANSTITKEGDRILLTMPFTAWIRVSVEPAEGAAA